LRLCIATLAAFVAMFALLRTASASQPLAPAAPEGVERGDALALSACSLDTGYASFWAGPASLPPASAASASVDPEPTETRAGCAGLLEDPLAPAPLCDPTATTGIAAAYVRNVADDRLEAGPGCGDDDAGAQSWLAEREPDSSAWQQSSLEPAHLSELLAARSQATSAPVLESAYPGHSSEGISMNIERPPMRR
jgi:hypothetical protein